MSNATDDDVPSPIDLRMPGDARQWVQEADAKRPKRATIRKRIADEIAAMNADVRVLELGVGPGALAEEILRKCPRVVGYTALDFSEAMLGMCRERLRPFHIVDYVWADFKRESWIQSVQAEYQIVVSMQAVHELRHKRHAVGLYRQLRGLMSPGAKAIVCDHIPSDKSLRATSLFMTEEEQHRAFRAAGFDDVHAEMVDAHLLLVIAGA